MAICQPVQAACKRSMLSECMWQKGRLRMVHILFISAAVAEGGISHQGYLLQLCCG